MILGLSRMAVYLTASKGRNNILFGASKTAVFDAPGGNICSCLDLKSGKFPYGVCDEI